MRHNRRPFDDVLIDTTDRAGHRWSVSPSGWMHPVVSGAEGEPTPTPSPSPQPSPTPEPPPAQPAPDTVPKAEAERREKEARKEAEKALLAQFGEGMTPDKIKQVLDAQKAAEDAKKDEATRLREEAEADRRAAAAEKSAAQQERLSIKIQKALLAANVKPERLSYAADLVKVAPDADDETISAAVSQFKEGTPEWFPAPGQPPAPSSLPVGTPPSGQPADDLAAARERGKSWRESRQGTSSNPFDGFRKIG